ncbi:MAG: hypothetical protein ACD_19C00140G0027 [uncultured bacterium]|nr:MAG: hypothetical protein ACD_19C00140G0027 [uncultured bacterium]
MRIIVLHGDDTQKSYARLQVFIDEAKKRGWKVTDFNIEEVENQSLFGEECFFILKDYKLLDKKTLEKLKKYSGNLIVYTARCNLAVELKRLNPDTVEKFELPILLWKFLDNMTVNGLHELVKTQAVEYVLAMMAWKFKQNYIKNSSEKNSNLIKELAEIDIKSKTGKADLLLSLDLLLSKRLQ